MVKLRKLNDRNILRRSEQNLIWSKLGRSAPYLSLMNDLLDIVWKTAPIGLVPVAMILSSHLQMIGWGDVFSDALLSQSGLIFVLVAVLAVALAIFLAICIPSAFILFLTTLYSEKHPLPRYLIWTLYASAGGYLLGIALVMYLDFPEQSLFIAVFVSAFLTAATAQLRKISPIKLEWRSWAKLVAELLRVVGSSLIAGTAAIATALPALVAMTFAQYMPEISSMEYWLGPLACVIITISTLSPAAAYLHIRARSAGSYKSLKVAFLVAVAVLYLTISLIILCIPVTPVVIRTAGIMKGTANVYQVRESVLEAALDRAGLTTEHADGGMFFKAYQQFGFGEIKILCKHPLDFSAVSDAAVSEAKRKGSPNPRLAAARNCVMVRNEEIRLVRE